MLFYLVHYPKTLERLTAEIRNTFANEDAIRIGPALNSCTYLTACLDESVRMNPQVSVPLFRDILPGGAMIQDQIIPEGTSIGAGIYPIHRNEAYFASPHTFIPERYLGTPEERKEAKKCWFPFSTGPRSCVGNRFAYVMMSLVVARLVYRYDMQLSPRARCCGHKSEGDKCTDRKFRSWIGLSVDGPVLQFRRRAV